MSNIRKKLAIVTTHPIQYNAPFFRKLALEETLEVKVFYTWDKGAGEKHDPGFGKKIAWDVPLLEGYNYTFVKNTSIDPGSHHFKGIINPSLINEIKSFEPNAILVYGWSFHSHLKVMRYFKGRVPVWFRGDSTLLDYEYRTLKDVFKKSTVHSPQSTEVKKDSPQKSNNKHSFFSCLLSIVYRLSSILKFKLRQLFLAWVYSHVDKAFYVGTNNKQYFLAHGLKEDQLVWLPHAVDNEFFQRNEVEDEAKAKEWRRELGIKDDDFVVLFAGKFEPKKNPELLVKAVMEMNEEEKVDGRWSMVDGQEQNVEDRRQKEEGRKDSTVHRITDNKEQRTDKMHVQESTFSNSQIFKFPNSPIHLIMVGNGILEEKLKGLAAGKAYIHFLPFQNQSQMPVVYRLGNVFCLPSQGPGETWGLALNEALACGRPVVASTKVGAALDLVHEQITGVVFLSNAISELKTALKNSSLLTVNTQSCITFIHAWSYRATPVVETIS